MLLWWYFLLKLWAAVVMVAIAVMTYGMQNSYSAHLSLSFCCPHFMCLKSYAAVLKYLLCLTVIVGLLLLLYTIDDVRRVMLWCESYVCGCDGSILWKRFGERDETLKDFLNPPACPPRLSLRGPALKIMLKDDGKDRKF